MRRARRYSGTLAELHVKIAQTPREMKELLEVGFDYVYDEQGTMFFRKRE